MNAYNTPSTHPSRSQQPSIWKSTVVSVLLLWFLWFAQNYLAERHWTTTLLTYLPQHAVVLPTAFLILRSAAQGHLRVMAANVAVLCVIVMTFLGLNVPLEWMYSTTRMNVATAAMVSPIEARSLRKTTTSSVKLRVMSYNILLGLRGVGDLSDIIKSSNADVLCLQEARSSAKVRNLVPRIHKSLPGWHLVKNQETATFSRYPILSQRAYPLPRFKQRVLLKTVIDVRGERVTIFNVHLGSPQFFSPANANLPLRITNSTRKREAQAAFVLEKAKQIKTPLIICGDFNTPPRGLIYRDFSAQFQDSFGVAGRGFGYTFHSDLPAVRIDYIWSSSHWNVQRCWVPKTDASDHRPLMADLQLS